MTLNTKTMTNLAVAALMLGLATLGSMYMLVKFDKQHVVGVVEVGEIQ